MKIYRRNSNNVGVRETSGGGGGTRVTHACAVRWKSGVIFQRPRGARGVTRFNRSGNLASETPANTAAAGNAGWWMFVAPVTAPFFLTVKFNTPAYSSGCRGRRRLWGRSVGTFKNVSTERRQKWKSIATSLGAGHSFGWVTAGAEGAVWRFGIDHIAFENNDYVRAQWAPHTTFSFGAF